jgi:hypothetical protein
MGEIGGKYQRHMRLMELPGRLGSYLNFQLLVAPVVGWVRVGGEDGFGFRFQGEHQRN